MNLSLVDINGEGLVVSQFTLYADTRRGRRPGFTSAAPPEIAAPLVEVFASALRERGIHVETGIFGADMLVEIQNDGPVTACGDGVQTQGAATPFPPKADAQGAPPGVRARVVLPLVGGLRRQPGGAGIDLGEVPVVAGVLWSGHERG